MPVCKEGKIITKTDFLPLACLCNIEFQFSLLKRCWDAKHDCTTKKQALYAREVLKCSLCPHKNVLWLGFLEEQQTKGVFIYLFILLSGFQESSRCSKQVNNANILHYLRWGINYLSWVANRTRIGSIFLCKICQTRVRGSLKL